MFLSGTCNPKNSSLSHLVQENCSDAENMETQAIESKQSINMVKSWQPEQSRHTPPNIDNQKQDTEALAWHHVLAGKRANVTIWGLYTTYPRYQVIKMVNLNTFQSFPIQSPNSFLYPLPSHEPSQEAEPTRTPYSWRMQRLDPFRPGRKIKIHSKSP